MNTKDLLIKHRRFLIMLTHMMLIVAAYITAFLIRFEFIVPGRYLSLIAETIPLLLLIKMVVFHLFGLYSGMWRYVSMHDLAQILKANIVSTIFFMIFIFLWRGMQGFPRSVFILDWILCVGFIAGVRLVSRSFRERVLPMREARSVKTLIVGAGESGVMVLKELMKNARFEIVGFIDDDPAKVHLSIYGIEVMGSTDKINSIVERTGAEEIVIAIPSASGKMIRDIISKCEKSEVRIKKAPGLDKILTGEIDVKQIREVQPEDLMGRKTVRINTGEVMSFIKGKAVLVTGAGGTIGSELCRQIAPFEPKTLVMYDYNENDIYFLELELREKFPQLDLSIVIGDIKDIGLLKHTFTKHKPEVVFHSAAHKHVPLMEENPVAAIKNNIIGTRNFMYAAEHYRVESFVMISTDKAVNPTSIMGASKRIAEMMIQAKAQTARTKFMAVRFGNVIGSSGSVVPIFKKQIEKGGPITVTDPEVKRYFMAASEAAQLVIQAGAIGKGGEVFILDMGEQLKIVDLARELIILSGLEPDEDIEIKFIGMRPGEKMHEEMLLDTEHDKATKHNKIYITQPKEFDPRQMRKDIKVLERFTDLMDESGIVKKIKEMVPTYNPNSHKETG
ncbi:MAG: polysaccharide biosynthesis protein [Candidatus Omnitrophica bacterium]|nr:polysaccharide biosynthesis protein [Candidatus Omnitrophota bacterium]